MDRTLRPTILAVAVATSLSPATQAAGPGQMTFTENFVNGNNTGGWTFGNTAFETIETQGGNPDAFYHNFFLDTFAPQPATTRGVDSPFVGDYRARGVSSVAIDLALFHVDFTSQGRPLSVLLDDDGGTPDDPLDDCAVYFVGHKPAPRPNGNWVSYQFRIPSSSTTLPSRWAVQGCGGLTGDQAWNRVIAGVDRLRFFVGDPELFFIFQVWDIGLDNPTITWGATDLSDAF